ncbi:MAG: NPCBM/NEW2 domain-containing protein [Clostridiales bacterium]|nr:NPCBM/NEW2 domain-containing protein [Clostridiales bacterium]
MSDSKHFRKAAASAALAATIFLTSCNSDKEVKELRSFLNESNYKDASAYFSSNSEKIKFENIVEDVEKSMNDIYAKFLNNELPAAEAKTDLDFLLSMCEGELEKTIIAKRDLIDKIDASRSQFNKAEQFFNEKNYLKAINAYKKVIPEDPSYKTAQAHLESCYTFYTEKVISSAAKRAEEDDYAEAIEILEEGLEDIGKSDAIEAKIKEYKAAYTKSVKESALKNAKEAADENNLRGAIKLLQSAINNLKGEDVSDLEAKLKEYETAYTKQQEEVVLNNAKNYADEKNYVQAVNVINDAIKNFEEEGLDTSNLKKKAEEYNKARVDALKLKALSDAKTKADEKDYEGAVKILTDAINSLENEDVTDLKEKIGEYEDAYVDAKIKEMGESVEKKDYYGVLRRALDIQELYKDNKKLKDFIVENRKAYLKELKPQLDNYLKEERYVEGYSICSKVLEVIPGSEELKKRMEKFEAKNPVMLSDIPIAESAYFDQVTDYNQTISDTVNNAYIPGNLYHLHNKHGDWGTTEEGYARIYLNKQYKKMQGVLAVDSISEVGDSVVTIYADNKEIYTGEFNRTTAPQAISLNVTGYEWLEIKVKNKSDDANFTAEILVSNFGFLK